MWKTIRDAARKFFGIPTFFRKKQEKRREEEFERFRTAWIADVNMQRRRAEADRQLHEHVQAHAEAVTPLAYYTHFQNPLNLRDYYETYHWLGEPVSKDEYFKRLNKKPIKRNLPDWF